MKKKVIWMIVIIVIVALVIVGGIYLATRNSGSENTTQTEEEQAQTGEYSLIDMENEDNVKIENGVKENNSQALLKEKELLGMKITNIRLAAENGLTNFTADVKNTSGSDFVGRAIIIVFKNEDGTEFSRLEGYLPDIKKGESNRIDASTTADVSNAYDFIIE